jgi:hypothetical protein
MRLWSIMAKILMTAIVADIRNKLNGSVFSKNRYGAYVRTKVTPVNPQSTAQQNTRNNLSTQSQAWRGLTESQRQAWIAAAADFPFTDIFGNTKILSGSALYVKLNNNLVNAGQAAISAPPSPVAIPALALNAINADESTGVVTVAFTDTPVPAGFSIAIQTTGNVGPGKSFVKNLFRQVTYVPAAGSSPATITAEFAAVHGAPVAGQKIFVRAFLVSTDSGQAGIPVQGMTIVVP